MRGAESDSGIQSHPHGHPDAGRVTADSDERWLAAATALILAFMVAEVIAAVVGRSLALLADAGHMLTDAAAVGASLYTLRLVRRPATSSMTFGWRRAEILAAAFNGLALLVVGVAVLVGAVTRLVHPVGVHGALMVGVAAVGVAVNLGATLAVKRADHGRLDVAGALAHLVTDVWAFGGTLVAGGVILATGWDRADPVASILVVGVMARAAWPLLRSAGRILLEGTPEGVDLDDVRVHLLQLPDVEAVHDLHAWVVGTDLPAVSAHVVVTEQTLAAGHAPQVLDELQACLSGHFDVAHSTFQLEIAGHADHESTFHE